MDAVHQATGPSAPHHRVVSADGPPGLQPGVDQATGNLLTHSAQSSAAGTPVARFQDEAIAIEGNPSLSAEQKNVKLHALRHKIVKEIAHESEGNGKVKNKDSIADLNDTIKVIDVTIQSNTVAAAKLEKQNLDLANQYITSMGDLKKVLNSNKVWKSSELKTAATYVEQIDAQAQGVLNDRNSSPELRKQCQEIIKEGKANLALIHEKLAHAS